MGGSEPQSERFFEAFVISLNNNVPLSPPRCRAEVFERLIDELLVELFVKPPRSRFQSLPPRLMIDLLWAKKSNPINIRTINIIRFIPFSASVIGGAA